MVRPYHPPGTHRRSHSVAYRRSATSSPPVMSRAVVPPHGDTLARSAACRVPSRDADCPPYRHQNPMLFWPCIPWMILKAISRATISMVFRGDPRALIIIVWQAANAADRYHLGFRTRGVPVTTRSHLLITSAAVVDRELVSLARGHVAHLRLVTLQVVDQLCGAEVCSDTEQGQDNGTNDTARRSEEHRAEQESGCSPVTSQERRQPAYPTWIVIAPADQAVRHHRRTIDRHVMRPIPRKHALGQQPRRITVASASRYRSAVGSAQSRPRLPPRRGNRGRPVGAR